MKKVTYILLAMLFVFGSVVMCGAASISTSATSTGYLDDDLGYVTDYYGYSFVITDDSSDSTLFHATFTNTSTGYDPLIYAIAFNIGTDNIEVTMGTHFDITNLIPTAWSITDPTGGGIKFDYVGNSNGPDDKLHKDQTLTFDFDFVDTFTFPANPFDLWLQTDGSWGKGLGGGEDFGQVAASFQKLGYDSNGGLLYREEGSDLLASDWEDGAGPEYVIPEPATMLLLGSGLIGFAVRGKKRFKKRNG